MQSNECTLSFSLIRRAFSSENNKTKLIWLLSAKDSPSILFDYINFSENLAQNLGNQEKIDIELNLLSLLVPGNLNISGIVLLDTVVSLENPLILKIDDMIHKIFSKNDSFLQTFAKPFYVFHFSSEDPLAAKGVCRILDQNEKFSEISFKIAKDEEIKESLKDYFFLFSSFMVEFHQKINENIIDDINFVRFKNSDIVIPVDKNKNIKFFEMKTKTANVNHYEIVKDKWKSLLKQIKVDIKKRYEENLKFSQVIQIIGKEIKLFFGFNSNGKHETPSIELITQNQRKSSVFLHTVTFFRVDTEIQKIMESHILQIKKEILLLNDYLKNRSQISSFALYVYQNDQSIAPRKCLFDLNENFEIETHEKKNFYNLYGLPLNRPFFRKSDSLLQTLDFVPNKNEKLKNVHLALNSKRIEGGEIHIIYGNYVYHHYCQDNFDDKGWGCAYRSLQSVLSWFIEQSYCPEFQIPTHKEIQQILISMGDKPKEFLGSSEWIGAFEVNLILNKLLNIDCKILHLSNGAEILTKINELKEHFNEQGTPVMFGGGVLAFTLLGIDHNEKTGETQFLILDPHYTGSDNIKNIVEKGGISWKKPDMFLPDTFYNFCLPLKPNIL